MRGGSGVHHPRRRRGMEAFAQAMGQHEIAVSVMVAPPAISAADPG
jgi:hypothetical protein